MPCRYSETIAKRIKGDKRIVGYYCYTYGHWIGLAEGYICTANYGASVIHETTVKEVLYCINNCIEKNK